MSGLSKVIVLDPDARAARQIQLGFQREGVPTWIAPIPVETGRLELFPHDGDDASLVVVGGTVEQRALDLIKRARGQLEASHVDIPIVFAGRGVRRTDAEAAGADEVVLQPAHLRDVVTIGRLLRGQPTNHRARIVGSLAETTGVFTLVRALSALGRSAVLTLIRGLRRGEVRFFHGEVTSAQVGLIHGQAALHQLLLWTDARFDFHHEDVVRRQQIPLAHDELFADAERFLAIVRDESGPLSPSMVLEQDVARIHSLGKQIPTEVHGVLRMFDGHRVLADVLEDSPYRVFETLRVTQRALDVGLLRMAAAPRPKATWRAVLAIEEWLVGGARESREIEQRAAEPPKPAETTAPRVKMSKRKRKKQAAASEPPPVQTKPDIDWGALVPRVVGAEVGTLSGVVPAAHASGEIVLPTMREEPRERLEALMDTDKRERIFPRDIGIEPKVVWDEHEIDTREAKAKADAEAAAADGASRDSANDLARRLSAARTNTADKARIEADQATAAEMAVRADTEARAAAEAKAATEAKAVAKASEEAAAKPAEEIAVEPAAAEPAAPAEPVADTPRRRDRTATPAIRLSDVEAHLRAEADAKSLDPAAAVKARVEGEASARGEMKAREEADEKARDEAAAKAREDAASARAEVMAREAADEQARSEAAAKVREEAAKARAEVKAPEEAEERARDEAAAKAREDAARARADVKAREEAEERARDEAAAKAREEAARARAEVQSEDGKDGVDAKIDDAKIVDAKIVDAKIDDGDAKAAEAKAREDADAQVAAAVEAKHREAAQAEAEAKDRAEAKARAEAAEQARADADAKAAAAVEAKFRAEAEARAKADAEERAKAEAAAAEAKARAEAEAKAAVAAAAIARAEAEAKARAEAERRAKVAADAKEAADRAEAAVRAEQARARAVDASKSGGIRDKRARAAKRDAKRRDAAEAKAIAEARAAAEARVRASSGAVEAAPDPDVSDTERTAPRVRVSAADLVKQLIADDQPPERAREFERIDPAALAIETEAVVVSETASTTVLVGDRVRITATEQTARLIATPIATVTEARGPAPEATPESTVDELSDGIVRKHTAVDTAPVPRRRHPPTGELPPDDRPDDATGEITSPLSRNVRVAQQQEPSILVSDLAAVHTAVSAIATAQAAAPQTPNASSPSKDRMVTDVLKDAHAAFTDIEEDFFRAGAEHTGQTPKQADSFDDLDEGYQPVGFWDRLLGRKKPTKKR